jgi:outer membrane biosynthesis protein TonB
VNEYVDRLQAKLSAEKLGPVEVREGILESYVVTNQKARSAGLSEIAIDAEDAEVLERVGKMMRDLLTERGGKFDAPTLSELRSVRHTMDLMLRFSEFPPEITEPHDMICEILLERASDARVIEGVVQPQSIDEPVEPIAEPVAVPPVEAPPVPESTPAPAPSSFPSPPPPPPQPSVEAAPLPIAESPFAASLSAKLSVDMLSPEDTRDGIIECFVASYRKTLPGGQPSATSEGRFEARVRRTMREFFSSSGASFDEPDIELFEKAKTYLEDKLGIAALSPVVLIEHNKICAELMVKGRKFFESIVAGISAAAPAVTEPAVVSEEARPEVVPAEAPVPEIPIEPVTPVTPAPVTPAVEPQPEPVEVAPGWLQEASPKQEVPATPSLPSSVPSVEELIARLRDEIREAVKQEVKQSLPSAPHLEAQLKPPSGIAAKVAGRTVFLAWLDQVNQPGYYVYEREGMEWVRLNATPLARPSFRLEVDRDGDFAFAVSSVLSDGSESERSEEVKVRV